MTNKDLIKHLTKLEPNATVFIKDRGSDNFLSILSIEQEFDDDGNVGDINIHVDSSNE